MHMNTRAVVVYFFVFLFLLSCTKEVEINIPPPKPKLVVYSTFVPFTIPYPKNFEVKVFASAHIFDTIKYPITDVSVQFFKGDELIDTLKYFSDCVCYSLESMFFPQQNLISNFREKTDYFSAFTWETM